MQPIHEDPDRRSDEGRRNDAEYRDQGKPLVRREKEQASTSVKWYRGHKAPDKRGPLVGAEIRAPSYDTADYEARNREDQHQDGQ